MSTAAPRISRGAAQLVAQAFDDVGRQAAQVRDLWQQVRGAVGQPRAPSEPSMARELRLRNPVDAEWGRSESLDPDNVGDIADEGAGHRG